MRADTVTDESPRRHYWRWALVALAVVVGVCLIWVAYNVFIFEPPKSLI
jgi:hypothetical protein